ncbi:hypothetical protein THRCLA_22678 [Thraustotheca clavata]|uniref:Uncharacterized protein n=1 Tax=Thraustotheca clavata TaxID=74557 RepID=A0A1V9YUK0_9STRA|nr:hypothetical protein THRCLA_22678 [Thraustotheca clavata]
MIVPDHVHGNHGVIIKVRLHQRLFGLIYLIFTSVLSIYFLYLIKPSVANDLWWRDFTTNGPLTFLADLYHHRLQFNRSDTVNLFAQEVFLEKEYLQDSATFIDMSLSLSRQVLLAEISFQNAIQAMRQSSFAWNVRMFTQYCWVDWNQTYEISITAKRQLRCKINEADNAAVYWESLFRNSHYNDVFHGSYSASLQISLFATITSTSRGSLWLASIWENSWLSVGDEAYVWSSHGYKRWQTELTNYYEQGLLQTIAVQNALGITQYITVHVKAQAYRGLSLWTLSNAYAGVWNDLWECQALNCSLIRGANNHSDQSKLDWQTLLYELPLGNTLVDLIDSSIGSFGSIDVKYSTKPQILQDFYLHYQTQIVATIWANKTLSDLYNKISIFKGTMAPEKWRGPNMTYFGGNPMCINNRALPFVQDQIGFYDSCSSQTENSMTLLQKNILFSLWTVYQFYQPPSIQRICQQTTSNESQDKCTKSLLIAMDLMQEIMYSNTSYQNATLNLENAMDTLNLTMIQFALNASIPIFLTQPVIATGDPWSFFGWSMVYSWLQGDREVFRFEADHGTFALITRYTDPTPYPANPLELPQQACTYIWIILVYSSLVLAFVAMIVVVATIFSSDQACGYDLFLFHRVASIVWVGRPFLALRGFAALIVLSTSPLTFEPRSVIEIIVIASESTWITYVLVDLLLPLTKDIAATYAPASAIIAWSITFFTEFTSPFEASATIDQSCYIDQLGLAATCTGGVVQIGSLHRLFLLSVVQLVAVLISLLFVCIWKTGTPHRDNTRNVYLPAAARYFLPATNNVRWYKNKTIGLMSGIIPYRQSFLHVNLWQLVNFNEASKKQLSWSISNGTPQPWLKSAGAAFLGIIYVLFSVGGSITFIFVSQTAMANDFWWAAFNSTGHQTFLATLFTNELQVSGVARTIDLTDLSYTDSSNQYNTTRTTLSISTLYATMIQNEVNTLTNVVQSLRKMDGCQVPWIATHFCYVDFNRTWEMEISIYRQKQCESQDTNNAAVYLEAYLRNMNWVEYDYCWNASLEIGILSYLKTSLQGQQWIQSVVNNSLTVSGEVNYWMEKNITEFITQWQNYKALGVLESFYVQNAFGMSHSITLKYSNGSMHTHMQTSFKMQWPFASQLWAVASNNSIITGQSLIRQSPHFAFTNTTMFEALLDNQTLVAPLSIGLTITQKSIGPFGEINMIRVPIPSTLVEWHSMIKTRVNQRMPTFENRVMEIFQSASGVLTMGSAPKSWGIADFVGGDITCPTQTTSSSICIYFSAQGACVTDMNDNIAVDNLKIAQALLSLGPTYDIYSACNHATMQYNAQCIAFLVRTRDFISAAFTSDEWLAIANLSASTVSYIQSTRPLSVVQYIKNTTGTHLIQSNIFDPEDVSYHVFGWFYLLEWISGVREVVQFNGQFGTPSIFSARNSIHIAPVNSLEVPLNVAYYARCVLLYVSSVLFLVACIACYYIAKTKANIEGFNMFSINRVAGLVWIGRTFLFLRGITAICLLSTAKLDLSQFHGFYYMVSVPQSWFMTIMASGEVTWLVFIINDSFSVVTKQYTAIYATKSSIIVWTAAAIWCLASSVKHQAIINRSCSVVTLDYQVFCQSGLIVIGDQSRFVGLIALAIGLVLICYIIQRCRYPHMKESRLKSHLLYATALHHFRQKRWIYNNVYHLDRASAAINGLISYYLDSHQVIVLDIKTWRIFIKPLLTTDDEVDIGLTQAIPLCN